MSSFMTLRRALPVLLILTLLVCAGCGQKGDLVRPTPEPSTESTR